MKPLYTWSTSTRMVDVMPVSDEGIRKLEEFVKEEKRKQQPVSFGRDDKAGACSACVYLSDRMEKDLERRQTPFMREKKIYEARNLIDTRRKKQMRKKKYRPLLG